MRKAATNTRDAASEGDSVVWDEFAGEPIDLWSARQAAHADFGDERLNTRMAKLLAVLARKPFDSIPQAHDDWGQTKAAYRFLENQAVCFAKIIASVGAATAEACAGLPRILAVQDTTSLNYSGLKGTTAGLGELSGPGDTKGLHLHSTLALAPDGVPLGLLHAQCWSRPKSPKPKATSHKPPFAERESCKWCKGVQGARAALAAVLPDERRPRLVHVMDREGDVYEVLQQIAQSGDGAVIRSMNDRNIAGPIGKARQAVRRAALLGEHTVDVPAKEGRAARQAVLHVRAVPVTIIPAVKDAVGRQPTQWTLVEAWEANPPQGVEPLHWLLWTTEPVDTFPEAVEVLNIYCLRWRVEEFHLTLKSGCRIEELRLETADRLANAIALYSPIAVTIVALRDLGRRTPDAPCTRILSADQWHVLWRHVHKEAPAPTQAPPTMRQAVLWIGRLGGHLNRKRDGMPGVRTLWRGWRDLTLLVAGYQAARVR